MNLRRMCLLIAVAVAIASCSPIATLGEVVVTEPVAPPIAPATQPETAIVAPGSDLAGRIAEATGLAADRGAEVAIAYLDRATGTYVDNGNHAQFATASIVKLFIADDLLFGMGDNPTAGLGAVNLDELHTMLRSSDDAAADTLWWENGNSDIVARVAVRYGLEATTPPDDAAEWWYTRTTTGDLVKYYDRLLSGIGGLSPEATALIVDDLTQFTPTGTDGYDQTFGIPDALTDEPFRAVKQGWVCCISNQWTHLSTGFAGDGDRYILTIFAREDIFVGVPSGTPQPGRLCAVTPSGNSQLGSAHATKTLTRVITTMFPTGRISQVDGTIG